jgi:hypothetical protein
MLKGERIGVAADLDWPMIVHGCGDGVRARSHRARFDACARGVEVTGLRFKGSH